MAQERFVPFGDFVAGGLINDRDVTFTRCRFEEFDYNGNGPEVCALTIHMEDSDGQEHVQHWPIGGQEGDYAPSKDGKQVVTLRDRKNLGERSNAHIFWSSLRKCGLTDEGAETIKHDISQLDGTKAHVIRVPAPDRGTVGQKKRDDGRPPEVLICSEVHSFPWDKGGKGARKGGSARGKAAAAKSDDGGSDADSIEAKTTALALKSLAAADDNTLELSDLSMEVFQAATQAGWDKADRKQAMTLAGDAGFLGAIPGVSVDGDTVSLG